MRQLFLMLAFAMTSCNTVVEQNKTDEILTSAPKTLSGTVRIKDELAEKAKGFRTIAFVFFRGENQLFGGQILQLEKDIDAKNGYEFKFDLNKVPHNLEMPTPEALTIKVRLAKSITQREDQPGDLIGLSREVKVGQNDIRLVVDTIKGSISK